MAGGKVGHPSGSESKPLGEPTHDVDHGGEGDPDVDDPPSALSAPDQLIVGVILGVRALYHPTFCDA